MALTPRVVVIAGPTGVGKTAVAVELARLLGSEIINADSMQVYRHLSIGTAKPSADELGGVVCHLTDHVDPDHQYNLGDFMAEACPLVEGLLERGKCPVVSGGTGLYLKGLLHGVFEDFSRDAGVRAELERRVESEGLSALYDELRQVDPVAAGRIMAGDRVRVVRALEVWHATGRRISDLQQQAGGEPQYPTRYFVLNRSREDLYARINARVEVMLERGLLDEVREYLALGYGRENPAIRALGYSEMIDYLHGDLDLATAVEAMKTKSRQYCKRQLTWFRSVRYAKWVELGHDGSALNTARELVGRLEGDGAL
ncbi:tRNA (adenosine(37)-N6)-dimethylallyltransferase MiaA [Candidatus Sumerlaeota bacterium]|nr:tRNA (adenosine(37)-N6)-dimethylallyltransferase MiaA [Candidatus Sumerlaeota bacterium]